MRAFGVAGHPGMGDSIAAAAADAFDDGGGIVDDGAGLRPRRQRSVRLVRAIGEALGRNTEPGRATRWVRKLTSS